jgi:HK97 family phage major capsid protein
MAPAMTIDELDARNEEIRARLTEIQEEFRGVAFPEATRDEWNRLNEERDANETLKTELEARDARLAELAGNENRVERGAHFNTARPASANGSDIWDLTTIRASAFDPAVAKGEIRDRALKALERSTFPQRRNQEDARGEVERLLENDSRDSEVGRRILATGSPAYRRAFAKYVFGQGLTPDEQRAMAVGVGSTGGFAVVFTLDPTIIPTSNLSVNPYRAICRVETIAGTNEWRGVTSAGVSATYQAEAAAVTDAAPTLAQPAAIVQMARCFIPVSIELTQDLPSLQNSLAGLIQDSKDDLEATQFSTGAGTTVFPQGILTGATTTVTTGTTTVLAIADLYKLEEALGPHFRPRASIVANRFIMNKVRQMDTAGGSGVWGLDLNHFSQLQGGLTSQVPTSGNTGARLLGYPVYECSAFPATLATTTKLAAFGDFSNMVIIDRVGMDIEVIPHLFGAAQGNLPTGQRGIFAYWRNTSKVLDVNPFRVLVGL